MFHSDLFSQRLPSGDGLHKVPKVRVGHKKKTIFHMYNNKKQHSAGLQKCNVSTPVCAPLHVFTSQRSPSGCRLDPSRPCRLVVLVSWELTVAVCACEWFMATDIGSCDF